MGNGAQDEQFMFTCELCGKRFKTNFELKKHLDKHPTEDNPLPYQCKYCSERFPDKAQQITHSNTVHANEGDFVCHLCGKKVSLALHSCFRGKKRFAHPFAFASRLEILLKRKLVRY